MKTKITFVILTVCFNFIIKAQVLTVSTVTASPYFFNPNSIAVDKSGDIYFTAAGSTNHDYIFKISPTYSVSNFTSVANGSIYGIATDTAGYVYMVSNFTAAVILKISPTGSLISTFTGAFTNLLGVAVDKAGNMYASDYGTLKIYKISPTGSVSVLAGNGTQGHVDGSATTAEFNSPYGIAVDANGNVYVSDLNIIRKITPTGMVSTLAGNGTQGYVNGIDTVAEFNEPNGLAVDANGNIFVADVLNNAIRKITPSGVVSTFAGTGSAGYKDTIASAAKFSQPQGVAIDSMGNLYVTDSDNQVIRKISNSSTSGINQISLNNAAAKAFPNPAYDHIIISVNSAVENNQVEIVDLQGQVLLKEKFSTNSTKIDVSGLGKGFYFIRANNQSIKFIKE